MTLPAANLAQYARKPEVFSLEGLQVARIFSPRFYGGFKWNRRVPW